jgi:double zinc ribbon protein
MSQHICPSCNVELAGEVRFCPNCGHDFDKATTCPSCLYRNSSAANFCQQCGTQLRGAPAKRAQTESKIPVRSTAVVEVAPPPGKGITIEFPYSSAQTFGFAIQSAQAFSTFKQYGIDKKAIYRVTFEPSAMDSALELLDHLKNWKRRTVYVDGEKVTWDSVFSFAWCYEKRKSSFKPEFYCFGYEQEYQYNIWGCIQAHLPFARYSKWFCWGRWLNKNGDWEFDKDRIRHELQRALYPYRFCPAMNQEHIDDALSALPNVVNPNKDKNWEFVTHYFNEETPVRKGVSPKGLGALRDIGKRLRLRLPTPPNRR